MKLSRFMLIMVLMTISSASIFAQNDFAQRDPTATTITTPQNNLVLQHPHSITQITTNSETGAKDTTIVSLPPGPEPISNANVAPEFPGDLALYISGHMNYPADAKSRHIKGTVVVAVKMDETGKIYDAHIEKNIYPSLDAEAMRLVNAMPKWVPGMLDDKPVKLNQWLVEIPFE